MLDSRLSRQRNRPGSAVSPVKETRPKRPSRPEPIARPPSTPALTRAGAQGISDARRLLILLVLFVVAGGGLFSRLVFWQVMQHGHLMTVEARQQSSLLVQPALRGRIFDAANTPMAMDVTQSLVYATPRAVKDPERAATLLAPILNQPRKSVLDLLTSYAQYEPLSPRVSQAVSAQIKKLKLSGIFLAPEIGRTYPNRSMAAQVLGYTNLDGQPNGGLEQYYDGELSGKAGLRSVLRDTAGNDVHLSSAPPVPSQKGADLYLTVDSYVQNMLETLLNRAVAAHSADGGSIIVMNPHTGAILGMANTPSFDPNRFWDWGSNQAVYRNPSVEAQYEPGSTFKVITMAAALDARVITPDTAFEDTGTFSIGNVSLHNWNGGGFGWETMTQVLQHSANVGAAWVAQRLGKQKFYHYVRRFGFGKPTHIDLAREIPGHLPLPGDKDWTVVNQYTNSFGQSIAATPIQMVQAVGAVANGGVMMKPRLVRQMVYDGRVIDHPPVEERRVISPRAAQTLTNMLVTSAIDGEASKALVKGYNIAAKTGTANVAGANGGYIQGTTIASVTGYAPAENPRFVVLIKIDHPKDDIWGSEVAAPVLHDVLQNLFWHYHIPPSPHALYR